MYVGDYLARRCSYDPNAVALVDAGVPDPVPITYGELNDGADRAAGWLRDRGVGPGDRVGYLGMDRIEAYTLFFASGKLGAMFAPLNWRLHPREVGDLAARLEPSVLLCDDAGPVPAITAHLADAGAPVVGLDEAAAAWAARPAGPVTEDSVTEETTACLLFTGGTTGTPKAAQISHRQVVWNTMNALQADVLPTDRFLNIFPLFHTGGLFSFSVPLLLMGGSVVQPRSFDADQVLDLIQSQAVTTFAAVPTVFQMLTDASGWERADLSGLRYCLSGGAPMPVPLIRRYLDEKGVVFRQGFGMTEFGPDVFSLSSEDAVRKAGSIGKPNFFVDARVVSPETGEQAPAGVVGELLLRGPSATTGYYRDPEATAAAFEEGGWFHTGDLARIDEEGYCFIVDRLKDMFVSGGENVYPAEIEAAIHEVPGVAMCAVVGVPDERWGEVGAAFVVAAPGAEVDEEAVAEHLRGRLAKFKVPRTVQVVDELPVSGAGKIQKSALKEMAR
ncbi:MAG: long-chain fatty acid--CoA ligase [Actinobacteria bacterium]|nr:long-chain fatty acid--CoA ligase [Actinomycetota bacterium]